MLNAYQKRLIEVYADGSFAHFGNLVGEAFAAELEHCGDGLFRFLMVDLSTPEGCESETDALLRLEIAEHRINQLAIAISGM